MLNRRIKKCHAFLFFLLPLALSGATCWAQSINATISGVVADPSGAVIPNVQLTLTFVATGSVARATSNAEGRYTFPNLRAGEYELKVSAQGFRDYVQKGISLRVETSARLDVKMELGSEKQVMEVDADASPLNFENSELKGEVAPAIIKELPLLISGGPRAVAGFAAMLPGVTGPGAVAGTSDTGAGLNTARTNGGMQYEGEAIVDGASIQESTGQNGFLVAAFDFPMSPDMISEIKVLTSNYEPQYGTTSAGTMILETKSGTNQFHGSAFEYLRNTVLNARQFGVPARPNDHEHQFGGSIGGPIKLPWVTSGKNRGFFFFDMEGFRLTGNLTTPILSIPSLKERQGDFSDWVDSDGNLIPLYDPATTRPNPAFDSSKPEEPDNLPYLRDQFMGCDGTTPNVICASDLRLQNSLAKQWFKFLPAPNRPGILNNYVVPKPLSNTINGNLNFLVIRWDQYIGDKDHLSLSYYRRSNTPYDQSNLPPQLSSDEVEYPSHAYITSFNWDHTLNPNLLNHTTVGYHDFYATEWSKDAPYADELPKIPGAFSHRYPPMLTFGGGFAGFGDSIGGVDDSAEHRPVASVNDLVSWVKGKHTLKFGGEYRWLANNQRISWNESGSLYFDPSGTGLAGILSGNSIASFLLEQVSAASVSLNPYGTTYPRAGVWDAHFGDTWKVTSKLTFSYGLRWDLSEPTVEKFDRTSFFDPLGPNPAAANRPGRLAFAGKGHRHPEETYKKAFAPRVGIAYAISNKTVVRTGYGIFYGPAFYPGWSNGIATDGFNETVAFSSQNQGMTPAFILSQGFPEIPPDKRPPLIDPSFDNGLSPNYRPFDANRLPYAQQWNLTIEKQITQELSISTSYVGNKGTRLISQVAPLNALDPKYLSMGNQLYDQFGPGGTSVDGVPLPYPGWVEQMTGCAPSVAQALLRYPQYCSSLVGMNENAGNSTFHSFQLKVENRFSKGIWLLGSYTLSKILTGNENLQNVASWSGAGAGSISPFERHRFKSLAYDDVPQTLSVALVYDLPFGKGKRWASRVGKLDRLISGWEVSQIFRASSGSPFIFRSSYCNVPSQFQAACIPAILPGADPFAQSKSSFDPEQPLFNASSFEDINKFNFYWGQGPRVSNVRGFPYYNQDFSFIKNTRIAERVSFQFRAELFNIWNWHSFGSSFDTGIGDPTFGMWTGGVTSPRNIQLGARMSF